MLYSICSFSSIGAGCVAILCESEACTEHLLVPFELHAVVAHVTAKWVSPIEFTAECRLFIVITVLMWAVCIAGTKNVRMAQWEIADWCAKQWSGWPVPAAGGFHEKKFDELIKNNWQTAEREIAVQLDNSQERVGKIIDVLPYHTVCARWVPVCWQQRRKFEELKFARNITRTKMINFFTILWHPMKCGCLIVNLKPSISTWIIITDIHMWKKNQNTGFGRKSHGCSFWYSSGVINVDCLEPETTINWQCYIAIH